MSGNLGKIMFYTFFIMEIRFHEYSRYVVGRSSDLHCQLAGNGGEMLNLPSTRQLLLLSSF
jgi:hypothetical protein